MARIFMINPVRNCPVETMDKIYSYVEKLEEDGHVVHFNHRDVDQEDDGVGLNICTKHRTAMLQSDEVHVWWDDTSKGSYFDLGMAFLQAAENPDLKFVVVNDIERTLTKSYRNVLMALAEKL